ncbi:hypothetical protein GQ55_2G438400 [Panicum hallii var. hallii]|uniref:Uncharacterized protein n=1 Tax=Panicum hallii var. hallii TaxID=1504633 RepID=A0A2T7EYR8_9POAL|nr:hypothetical protein GQ55_2G438400 [Panicum hallii var. hallii]
MWGHGSPGPALRSPQRPAARWLPSPSPDGRRRRRTSRGRDGRARRSPSRRWQLAPRIPSGWRGESGGGVEGPVSRRARDRWGDFKTGCVHGSPLPAAAHARPVAAGRRPTGKRPEQTRSRRRPP